MAASKPYTPYLGRVHVAFDESGEVVEYELRPSDEEAQRGWKAMMLAKDLETCRALLRGESVPESRLRPEWVEFFDRLPSDE